MARRSVKKNIISLVSGLVIIGGTIGTSVALLNMMYKDTTTFTIKYSDLNKIYENIINSYGVNSKDSALTINDFKLKVEDGSIKKWILDNYRNYFVSDNSDNELNFNLSFSDNSLIFTPMRNIKFNFRYDITQVDLNFELKDNKIYLHFDNSDFIQNQYFTLSLFNSFKTKLIQEMQKRNLVFSDFISVNDEQLLNVKKWIINLFNIGDIFESVSFEPYTLTNKSNLYSMKLKPTKYYMFSWNSGISNNDEYQVFKNEVVINFTKTITLNQNTLISLFNKVNEFIWNQRIDYYVWVEHFNQKDNKYDEFKQFVYNELNNLLNNELDSVNAIGDLTLSNNNGIFSLNISSANGYDFISKSSYLNVGNIVLSNLEFYKFINFAPINFTNFFDALQNYILDNKYTIQEFANWFNTNSFKQFISQNLSNSSGELLNSELIGDVSFDQTNNLIEITPATMYQFQETTSTKNLSINTKGNIVINNLEYYTLINLTKLDTLFNAVQNKISSSQWTNEEFADFVKNNNDQIKQLISKNLFINSTDLIDLSQIDTVTISDDFKLVIILTSPNKGKYTADENKNVSLNTNTLTISNLTYFTITNFTNLSTLQRAIQEKIDTNRWTSNQFLEYVEDNQKDIIDFVSTKLSITNNSTLPSSQISRIDFINETLRISLTPPDNVKYSIDKTDNFKLSNNVLIISNFTYFTDVILTKLNILHNAIQSEISSNKATEEEFSKFITNQQEAAKKLIANNLFVSEMSTISQSSIDSVVYNDGNVDITLLVPNNIKYSLNPYTNATLNNNVLTISNFTYFTNVELDVSTLKTAIENLISTKKATASEFESYIKTNQVLLKSLVVEKVGGLDNTSQISSIKYNNSDIEISLVATTNTKYILENSFDDIKLSNDILTISNLNYFNDISLLNINNLYLAIQELIDSKQFTESDFGDYLSANKPQIINTIASKLYIANNTPILPSEISDVSLNSKSLVITINSKNFTKYNLVNDTNWMFNENTNELTLMNLSYFNLLNLGDLTSAYDVVQNKITSSKSTAYEFSSYLLNTANKSSLITDLETELNKNLNNVTISIKDVAYNNSNIDIVLNNNNNKYKYTANTSGDWELKNDTITFKNFTYFTITNLVKLNELFDAFNNLINTSKYTQSDLSDYINDSVNGTNVKKLVADNLYVSDTIKIDSSQIGTISSNANGIITINLVAPANIKYTAEENENVIISDNKISILNLKYYSEVRISSLSNTYNYFQKIISDNNYYISSSFGTYVTQNQSTIKSEFINNSSIIVIGSDGSTFSSSDITSVTFNSSEQLVFTLSNVSYRKYSIQSATNVTVSGNTITFSGFNWAIHPNESYFTWNGNQITGLTTLGTQQTNIILPPRATSINNIVFMNNKTIKSVDMSLTRISSIPNGASSGVGLFYNATNLVSVSLPPSLTSIGDNSFSECTSLTSITLPDSLEIIGNQVFFNCKSLTSINLPNSIYSIGYQTFYSCSLRSVTLPNSLSEISSDLFWRCGSLISVDIPNSVRTIQNYSFYECYSLRSITMSNLVTSIGLYTFGRVPSDCVMIVKSGWNTQLATNADYKGTFRYI